LLKKLEDCASNMATGSQLAAWMDSVIRALRRDFAKDTEPAFVAMLRVALSYFLCKLMYNTLEGGFPGEEICCFLELMDLP
jgi:hypothetical protein